MSTTMSPAEREAFLADLHVGVLAIADGSRGPLTAPVWYAYEPGGEAWLLTDANSLKGRLLKPGVRVSLVAQTETPPYSYVSIEGPVAVLGPADTEQHLRPMAHRYLGTDMGDGYVAQTLAGGGPPSLVYSIRPERWLSVDYSKVTG